MIKFILEKMRTLRWFIFLAVFFSTSIVFIGVSGISSLLYENLMAEQASYITEQLMVQPPEHHSKIDIPSITTEVRLTYIGTFFLYSFIFLIIAFIFSHFAIRRINLSIAEFSQQISQIKTRQELENFTPNKVNFVFSELNQAFENISDLARQLGRVLNDKSLLEIKARLLSKLVIKNTKLDDWNEYIQSVFIDIYKTLPFDFIAVYLIEDQQQQIKIYWYAKTTALIELQMEQILTQKTGHSLSISHLYLTQEHNKDFQIQPALLVSYLEKETQIGAVQGVFVQSSTMQDVALRLRINSILVVLLNLLGSSRAISGYTQQLETAIHLSEQENAMAAEVLYGHLLVKNTDNLAGINYKICPSSRFSGDIIQVKRSPSGSTFILVADATGHGLSATITIMPVISVFNAMVQKGYQLPFILNEMNKHLLNDLPDDRFVAAVLIELDPAHNEISVWNGAMPPVLQLNSQGETIASFNSKNMALGILDEVMFDSSPQRINLPKDGYLIAYSDGLTEQENTYQQAFGHQQLVNNLQQKINDAPVNSIIQAVLDYAELEQPDDDISLCQIDFLSLEGGASPISTRKLLCNSLDTPFEWQIKIYGSKIAQQSLPALCNEFMQTQGLSMPVKRWAFSVVHELIQAVIDANFIQKASNLEPNQQVKREILEQLSDKFFLQLKFKASLKDCDNSYHSNCTSTIATTPCLSIEVSDNAIGDSSLVYENDSLANIRALADKVVVSQQGHHIKVSVG